jgi:hypothetical protein
MFIVDNSIDTERITCNLSINIRFYFVVVIQSFVPNVLDNIVELSGEIYFLLISDIREQIKILFSEKCANRDYTTIDRLLFHACRTFFSINISLTLLSLFIICDNAVIEYTVVNYSTRLSCQPMYRISQIKQILNIATEVNHSIWQRTAHHICIWVKCHPWMEILTKTLHQWSTYDKYLLLDDKSVIYCLNVAFHLQTDIFSMNISHLVPCSGSYSPNKLTQSY